MKPKKVKILTYLARCPDGFFSVLAVSEDSDARTGALFNVTMVVALALTRKSRCITMTNLKLDEHAT